MHKFDWSCNCNMPQLHFQYFTITIISLSIAYANEIVTEGPPGDENLNYTTVTSFTTYQTDEEITNFSDYDDNFNYTTVTSFTTYQTDEEITNFSDYDDNFNYTTVTSFTTYQTDDEITFSDYDETTTSTTQEAMLLPPVFDVTEYVNNCPPGGIDSYFSCEEEAIIWQEYGETFQEKSEEFCDGFQDAMSEIMYYSCRPSSSFAEDVIISFETYMENYNMEFPENITDQRIEKRKEEYIKSFETIRKMQHALNLSEELRELYIKIVYQTRIVDFLEHNENQASNKSEVQIQIEQEVNLLNKYKESFGALGKSLTKYLKQNNVENVFNLGNLALILNTSLRINTKIEQYPIELFTIEDIKMRIQIQQKFTMLKIPENIMLLPVFNVTHYENDCPPGGIVFRFPCEEEAILWEKYGKSFQETSEKFCQGFQNVINEMMYYSCRPSQSYAEDVLISSKTYMENHNAKFPENITQPQIVKRKEEYIKSFNTIFKMEHALNLSEQFREGYIKMVYQANLVHFLVEYKEKRASNNSDIYSEIQREVNLLINYKKSFGVLGKNLTIYLKQNDLNVFNSGILATILNSSLHINNSIQQYPIQQFFITDNKMRNEIQQKIKMLNIEQAIMLLPVFNVTQYESNCPPRDDSPFPCDEEPILWEEYGESLQEMSEKFCNEFQAVLNEMMYYSCKPSPKYAEDALSSSKTYMENYNITFPENITNPQLKERKEEYIKSFETIRKMEQALNLSDELRKGYIKMAYQGRMVYFLKEYKEKQVSNDSDIYPEIENEVNLLKKYKESFAALGKNLTKYLNENGLENVFNFGKLALILKTALDINNKIHQHLIQQFIVTDYKMRNIIRQKMEKLKIEEAIMLTSVFDVTQYENNCSAESFVSRFPCKGESILWEEYGTSLQEMSEKLCDHFQDVIFQMMHYSCRPSSQTAENVLKISITYREDSNIYFPDYIKEQHLRERKEDYIKSFDTILKMEQALNISEEMRDGYIKIFYQARLVKFLEEFKQKGVSNTSKVYLEIEEENKLLEKYKVSFGSLGRNLTTYLKQNELEKIFKSGRLGLILNSLLDITTPNRKFSTEESIIEDNQYRILAQQKVQKLTLNISPILVVILLAVGLTGNMLLLAIFIKYTDMRTVGNLMIMNLTIIDCISLLLNLPTQYFWVASSWHDKWGCSIFQFSRKFSITVSTYSIDMISLQRYLAVKIFPKTGRCTIGKRTKTAFQFISVWIFGFLYNIPRLSESSIEYDMCIDVNLRILPIIVTADFLFICIIPSVSIVLLSVFTASNIKTSVSNVPGETTGQQELKKDRMLSAHVLTGLAFLFVISYFPYFVFQFMTITCGVYLDPYAFATIHTCTYCLLFTNSCLNPIALGIMSKKYRKYYLKLIGCFKCTPLKILGGQSTSIASVATTETSM